MISGMDQPFSFSYVWIHTDESVGSIAALASGQMKRERGDDGIWLRGEDLNL